jgi:hypothetical protein
MGVDLAGHCRAPSICVVEYDSTPIVGLGPPVPTPIPSLEWEWHLKGTYVPLRRKGRSNGSGTWGYTAGYAPIAPSPWVVRLRGVCRTLDRVLADQRRLGTASWSHGARLRSMAVLVADLSMVRAM